MLKYDDLTGGQVKAFVQKCGGADIVPPVLSGEIVLVRKSSAPTATPASPGFPSFTGFNHWAFLDSWRKFYQEAFTIQLEARATLLPPMEEATGAGVVIAGDVTIEMALTFIQSRTPGERIYRYVPDVDAYINRDAEAPRPDRPYAVWCAPAVEAIDQAPEIAGKSWEDMAMLESAIPTMNALEYLVFFAWHLWATKNPLDMKSVTLTDSLDADGYVLYGRWDGDMAYVDTWHRRDFYSSLRARRIVLPTSPKAA